jgi:hypothetical protein
MCKKQGTFVHHFILLDTAIRLAIAKSLVPLTKVTSPSLQCLHCRSEEDCSAVLCQADPQCCRMLYRSASISDGDDT